MTDTQSDRTRTGLLLVDPYNDFLASEGKLWPFAKDGRGCEPSGALTRHRGTARQAGIQAFFVPHHRGTWRLHEMEACKPQPDCLGPAPDVLPKDTWGGTFHEDFQPQESDIIQPRGDACGARDQWADESVMKRKPL